MKLCARCRVEHKQNETHIVFVNFNYFNFFVIFNFKVKKEKNMQNVHIICSTYTQENL